MPPPSHTHFHVLILFASFGSLLLLFLLLLLLISVLLFVLTDDWLSLFDFIVLPLSDSMSTFFVAILFGVCMQTNIRIETAPETRQIAIAMTCNDDFGVSIS